MHSHDAVTIFIISTEKTFNFIFKKLFVTLSPPELHISLTIDITTVLQWGKRWCALTGVGFRTVVLWISSPMTYRLRYLVALSKGVIKVFISYAPAARLMPCVVHTLSDNHLLMQFWAKRSGLNPPLANYYTRDKNFLCTVLPFYATTRHARVQRKQKKCIQQGKLL